MIQIFILITGAVAVFLTQSQRLSVRRWACFWGLAGQPFWLFSTWDSGQWGMFCLSLVYSIAWVNGVWVFWWPKPSTSPPNSSNFRSR